MTVIEQLTAKRDKFLDEYETLTYSSVPKSILKKKVDILEELINVYDNFYKNPSLTFSPAEVEKVFDQQYGFEPQKQKILTQLKISVRQKNTQVSPIIWCLVGAPGTGKTTFAQLLAKALKKELFSFHLGGMTDASLLTGKEEEIGLLTNALLKTQSVNSLFLFDEIDKASDRIQNSLLKILDNAQNNNVFNHYLDVNLDFSHLSFVATANKLEDVPLPLRERMTIIELSDYTVEQKKEITQKIIQKWFAKHESFNQNNFTITPEAVETLINKTSEKGVRQLERGLDSIFDYCILQWLEEAEKGETESKITINSELVNQIIPHHFFKAEKEEKRVNSKAELAKVKKDFENLQKENNKLSGMLNDKQEKLAKFKNGVLLLWQRNKESISAKNHNYETEIKNTDSWEELQVIKEEILVQIRRKNTPENFRKNQNPTYPKPDKREEENKQRIKELEERLRELEKNAANNELKKEIQKLTWIVILLTIGIIIGFIIIKPSKKKKKKQN